MAEAPEAAQSNDIVDQALLMAQVPDVKFFEVVDVDFEIVNADIEFVLEFVNEAPV